MKIKNMAKVCAAASFLLLGACSSAGTGGTANGGGSKTMFLGMVNPPVNFSTINSPDVASSFIEKFMFDSFLEMDGPQNFVPKLAKSFETTDNQTFTIKLDPDAKWSDGKPVTAEDAAYTFNMVANPKVETTVGSYLSMLDGLDDNGKLKDGQTEIPSVKVVDDKTLQFKTKAPVDPNMIKEQLGTKFLILPKHVLSKVKPEDLAKDSFFLKPDVTNGPFTFVEYKKNQDVQLKANPDYYGGKPKLENLYVKIMPAPNLAAQLQTGELHMNVGIGIGKIPPQDYKRVEKLDNVRTKSEKTIGFQTMMFNTEKIKDAKVRQALVYALDRQKIVDKLLKGYGEVVDGPYTSVSPYLDKDLKGFSYDPEKAKQMLKDAGWDFDKTLQLVVPIGNKVREQSADIISENLKAAGVKVKTTTYDFPTIMQKGKAGDYDLLLMGFTFTLDPEISSLYSSSGAYNYMKYSNPKVDELLLKGKSEPDPDKRKEIYSELQKIWDEDMPIITLYSDDDFDAISKQVKKGEPRVFGFHKDIVDWSVAGAK
ncbi:ABC transporter substrate-binding protein [Falsibacillus pallidus]|uniref:Peptide/nickel transport system substrate-binding protein n=1 Tax=Falsibacillus pallidus TaxID=493781 RepID=A0A370GDR2_9BACI|nr:ABC transporter substrate-binding protein [Falsibacillus pallidus]RDI41370.1 peptide/nickel transport system substrate-binding protein [Falsibacillus pallidus]